MRIEGAVTSVSWIPSEAIEGIAKMPFKMGIAHFDDPPPEALDDHAALIAADRCRFVNHLSAFIEVDDTGRITDLGQDGGGLIGSTTMKFGTGVTFGGVPFPDLRPQPEIGPTSVRFTQTCGGHTGVPAPRRVRRAPYIRFVAPTAWTTVELTLHTDGSVVERLVGASPFPRHWIYGADRSLLAKSGVIDYVTWYRDTFVGTTPWGGEDSPAIVATVETALERQMSLQVMRGGAKPMLREYRVDDVLMRQGEPGDQLMLILDGVVVVDVDGHELAELGPGAMLGERALLEGGSRTSTVTARTKCRVAIADASLIDPAALIELREGHRREEKAR